MALIRIKRRSLCIALRRRNVIRWRCATLVAGSGPGFAGLRNALRGYKVGGVNTQELTEIHKALAAVHDAVGTLTFPSCDQDDMFELMDRVESELTASHPNAQVICTFLNSIARSLRNQPEAREACLRIEDVIERTGLPSTWQAGI